MRSGHAPTDVEVAWAAMLAAVVRVMVVIAAFPDWPVGDIAALVLPILGLGRWGARGDRDERGGPGAGRLHPGGASILATSVVALG